MTPIEILRAAANFIQAESASGGELPTGELRFILEPAQGHEKRALVAELAELLESEQFLLDPLFEPGEREAVEFWVLRFPGVENTFPDSTLFEMAYVLDDRLSLLSCEPDLSSRIYTDPQPKGADGQTESTSILGDSCWVDKPEPSDFHWALKSTRVDKAWQISPSKGAGILIGQPDTGVAPHPELEVGALRFDLAKNIVNNSNDPTDPLDPGAGNPGHGSSTSSVAISRQTGSVSGSAPGAELVPIRAIESVVVFNGAPVAKAVDHARRSGCHVITMSLGGNVSRSLRKAIRRAVDDNIIVMAAAGNCVRLVVYPARFSDVIAVGGVNVDDKMWKGSSRGSEIDFSAPAELVWRARHDVDNGGTPVVSGGQGTSFAVALSAGIAALWLSHHGRDELIAEAQSRGINVQELFRIAAKSTARKPSGWNSNRLGSGIIDAEELLNLAPGSIPTTATEGVAALPDIGDVRPLVLEATGRLPSEPNFDWEKYEAEISNMILNDARFGKYSGVPGAENNSSSVVLSKSATSAIGSSGDPALTELKSEPRQIAQAIQRIRSSNSPPASRAILARDSSSPFESASTITEAAIQANLDQAGIKNRLDKAESRLNQLVDGQPEASSAQTLKKDILEESERVLTKLRDEGDGAEFTRQEKVALEALVKLEGRPAIKIEDGSIDFNDPILGDWQGQAVLLRQTIETLQTSVGRINLGGTHVGTGFVVGDGLIMTNRHVLEGLAIPLPGPNNPEQWIFVDHDAAINFSESGKDAAASFKIKSVAFSGANQILNQPVDFDDLDMAILEVESTNVSGNSLPSSLTLNNAVEAVDGAGELFMMGYPAMPRTLPKTDDGNLNMDVVNRLSEIFGQSYSVKYLSMGIVEHPIGTLPDDPMRWVFAHDATTLAGYSGSAIIRVADGPAKIVGLHFAGDWLRANFAHSMKAILDNNGVPPTVLERLNLQ